MAMLRAGLKARLLAAGKGQLDEEDLALEEGDGDAGAGPAAGSFDEQLQHFAADGGREIARRAVAPRAGAAAALPPRGALLAAARAALGVASLLVLKQYLMAAYWLSEERVAAFAPKGERRRAEEKAVVARNQKVNFSLSVLNLLCLEDATGELLAQLFVTLKVRTGGGLVLCVCFRARVSVATPTATSHTLWIHSHNPNQPAKPPNPPTAPGPDGPGRHLPRHRRPRPGGARRRRRALPRGSCCCRRRYCRRRGRGGGCDSQ